MRRQAGNRASCIELLYHQGANITALDQYATEAQGGRYFMRVEFELDHLQSRKEALMQTFAANVAERYEMQWKLTLWVNKESGYSGF